MPRPTRQPEHPPAFLAPYIETLAGMGIQATPRTQARRPGAQREQIDAVLDLRGPWGKATWACELKHRLERGTAGPAIHRMQGLRERLGRALLLTEYVTPPLAEELRQHDVAFVDAAGNAYLKDDGLYVWVTHRPRRNLGRGEPRGLHAAGLKLLCILLRQRTHHRNLRELAAEAGIALGGVARILRELERRAWIRRVRDGFELQDPEAMLKRWDEGYADTLRPKLFVTNCRRRPGVPLEQLADTIEQAQLVGKVHLGGELGAARLTQYLRAERATLHLDGIEPKDAMRALDLLPDPEGDVALVRAFGRPQLGTAEHPALLADPLWIHAELLLHPDERLREVAEKVRADHIEPRWK